MKLTYEDKQYDVEILGEEDGAKLVSVNGNVYAVNLTPRGKRESQPEARTGEKVVSKAPAPASQRAAASAPPAPAQAATAGNHQVVAPMPGTVLKIAVSPGQVVSKGDQLLVLESMKMENSIPSPKDGTVAKVLATEGGQVNRGAVLIEYEG